MLFVFLGAALFNYFVKLLESMAHEASGYTVRNT